LIDIHSHILPGLDDGAQTWDEAIAMARAAEADGISTVIATPHGIEWGSGCTLAEAEERVAELQKRLAASGVSVTILPGLENYISPDLTDQVVQGTAFALNHTSYFLVELPLQGFPLYTEEVLFQLQAKGLIPVLAHPERNSSLQENHELLAQLVGRGMLAQVTAASIVGGFGTRVRKAAEAFLRRNLVQVIASDAHSTGGGRSPILSEAVAAAAKLVGPIKAEAMVTTRPRAILAGEEVAIEPPLPAKERRRWAFWR